MSRRMTLCPECRTIQKAATVCTICGAKVEPPKLMMILPEKKAGARSPKAENSDPETDDQGSSDAA